MIWISQIHPCGLCWEAKSSHKKAETGIILTSSRKLLSSLSSILIKEYPRENSTSGDSNEHFRLAFKCYMLKEQK